MFIAYSVTLSASRKKILERWASQNTLTTLVCGSFVVGFSDRWKLSKNAQGVELFEGVLHPWGQHKQKSIHPEAGFTETSLGHAIGYFTCVSIESDEFRITRSLYRSLDIFYTTLDGEPILCSHLPVLIASRGGYLQQTLDTDYCRNYIGVQQKFGGQTPFLQIRELMLGERMSIGPQGRINTEFVNRPLPPTEGIADTLKNTLATFSQSFDHTLLMFSGGLDSSTLLWALKACDVDTLAIHNDSKPGTDDSEYEEARVIASDLGNEVMRIEPEQEDDFSDAFKLTTTDKHCSLNSTPIFSHQGPAKDVLELNGSRLILTGHGGDQVFIQNPGANACFSLLSQGRYLSFFRTARKLSRLKGASVYEIIKRNLSLMLTPHEGSVVPPAWLGPLKSKAGDEHYLLRGLDRRSAKYSHLSTILLALHSTQTVPGRTTVLAPLLLQNIIGHVVDTPVEHTFSDTHDRIIIRQPIYERTGKAFAWRRTKRSSSVMFFKALSSAKSNLISTLNHGVVISALGIDRTKILADLEMNCEVALTESLKNLMNVFKLEKYLFAVSTQSDKLLSHE
ncbi:asparagine synthase-related protein [Pseudomonas batumici]|uniref:asparagine synthase-related protein n=1 Tax=Pseudomonas batumici TaxID=226910 RepID=UPI0030CB849C